MSSLTTARLPRWRKVNGKRVVSVVAYVRIGAAFEQRPHNGLVPRAKVQRRAQTRIAWERAALVDDVGMLVEDRNHRGAVAFASRGQQRRQRRFRGALNSLCCAATVGSRMPFRADGVPEPICSRVAIPRQSLK